MTIDASAAGLDSRPLLVATLLRPDGETGVQTHARSFLRAAADSGARASLVTPFELSPLLVVPAFAPGRLVRPLSPSFWVAWYRESHGRLLRRALARQLRGGEPAVVYAQDPVSASVAVELREAGYPIEIVLAIHFNGSEAEEWAQKRLIASGSGLFARIQALEERVVPRVDRLIFPSRYMRRQIGRRIPRSRQVPSVCVPNFVYEPGRKQGMEPAIDLISIGTLEPRKNQRFLLEVVAAAHRLGYPYQLRLVGDGPSRQDLIRRADELGIRSAVTFAGHVDSAATLLHHHRAYVHAAVSENLPIALIEALAAGKPIFAGPVGGIPEIFTDGVEGRCWDLGDAEGAARMLIDVLGSPAELRRMSELARSRYLTTFSPAVVGSRALAAVMGDPDSRAGDRGGVAASDTATAGEDHGGGIGRGAVFRSTTATRAG